MRDLILFIALLLLFIFSFFELLGIKAQAQKIAELEKGVIYFSNEADKLRAEQDKQARILATDLYIKENGYEMGK